MALDPLAVSEETLRPSLEQRLEAIVSGAALLADSSCTRDAHRERIIAECSAIRRALQHLLAECIRNRHEQTELVFMSFCEKIGFEGSYFTVLFIFKHLKKAAVAEKFGIAVHQNGN
ncbi:hypothetical protein WISP_04217 [Willisornis vidua]|uniref:Uncharacterized protein n=1 Tax=Willisornis vidua TaxID=1566151 RepID=A0ABQ9DTD6_9PASS|nr:hypothetical protein WISP_04217 [Willisornis vidua]